MRGGLYVLTGPDRVRKQERLAALARELHVNALDRHRLDADGLEPRTLGALIRQHPAASPVRLVILDDAQRLDAACAKLLAEHAPAADSTTCVALLVDGPIAASHPLASLKSLGRTEQFEAAVRTDEPGQFALVEAIGRRDAAAALATIDAQFAAGKEPVELLGMIVWQVNRWISVARLVEQQTPKPQIAELTGIKAWQLDRVLAELSSRPTERLARWLEACRQLDGAMKSGRTIPKVGLETLVLELCRTERPDVLTS